MIVEVLLQPFMFTYVQAMFPQTATWTREGCMYGVWQLVHSAVLTMRDAFLAHGGDSTSVVFLLVYWGVVPACRVTSIASRCIVGTTQDASLFTPRINNYFTAFSRFVATSRERLSPQPLETEELDVEATGSA